MCEQCLKLPKCEGCEVIFGEIIKASKENPKRCNTCLDFEKEIKDTCVECGVKIPKYYYKRTKKLQYVVRGNYCGKCNAKIMRRVVNPGRFGKLKTFLKPTGLTGYLELLHTQMLMGQVSEGAFEEAKLVNPQDIIDTNNYL